MRVKPEHRKTVPRGSRGSYKENVLSRKGARHGAVLTVAAELTERWIIDAVKMTAGKASLGGTTWLDDGMCALLFFFLSFKFLPHLCLNSSPCDSTLSTSSQ